MKQEQKSKRVSEKLWNLSQSSGTTSKHFGNDWDVVLGLAVENSWTEEPNDRFQEHSEFQKCVRYMHNGGRASRGVTERAWSVPDYNGCFV